MKAVPEATLATICYTSGTSGRPKGVMLSHGNILANVAACLETRMAAFVGPLPFDAAAVAHVRAHRRLLSSARPRCDGRVCAWRSRKSPTISLAGADRRVRRAADLRAVRCANRKALAESRSSERSFDACVAPGYRVARGEGSLLDRLVAKALRPLVAAPILAKIGGKLRLAVVGGAALDPALARMFGGLGLPLLQGYGLTEASPVISVNRDTDNDPESVGAPLPGIEVKLLGDGELAVRGPSVMLGYWRNDEATRAAIDADRWLHTGDIAEIRAGKIYIRGRAKDILVMSNGEKLPPQDVELALLHDPVFEQVMLVGEGRPFPILLAVTQETDEKTLLKRANDLLTGSRAGSASATSSRCASRGTSTAGS